MDYIHIHPDVIEGLKNEYSDALDGYYQWINGLNTVRSYKQGLVLAFEISLKRLGVPKTELKKIEKLSKRKNKIS